MVHKLSTLPRMYYLNSACEGETREVGLKKLKYNFSCLDLTQSTLDEIQEIEEKGLEDAIKESIPKPVRKEMTSIMRKTKKSEKMGEDNIPFDEDNIRRVKESIKMRNRELMSPLVTKMLNICLPHTNKINNVTFPTHPEQPNPNTGKESSAKNHLRTISDDIEEKGLSRVKKKFVDKIVQHMLELFYYPRIDNVIKPNSAKWERIRRKRGYNKGTQPRNNNPEILFQVTARHIVLVFNCFKGLSKLDPDIQDSIVKNFLKGIIEKQGWEKEGITLGVLKLGIAEYTDRKEFKMKPNQSLALPNKPKTPFS